MNIFLSGLARGLVWSVTSCALLAGSTVYGIVEQTKQEILDDLTVGGPSSVNAATDAMADPADSLWSLAAVGGSVETVIIELASFADQNKFGIWDATDPSKRVQVFDGGASASTQGVVSIMGDGSVKVNFADTGIDFAGNLFGFYLESPQGVFYSDTSLNSDGFDHMMAYQGTGDLIQLPGYLPGIWTGTEYMLFWEDLLNGGDMDHNDFVVLVDSVVPVPEPATYALLGSCLLFAGVARRRKLAQKVA